MWLCSQSPASLWCQAAARQRANSAYEWSPYSGPRELVGRWLSRPAPFPLLSRSRAPRVQPSRPYISELLSLRGHISTRNCVEFNGERWRRFNNSATVCKTTSLWWCRQHSFARSAVVTHNIHFCAHFGNFLLFCSLHDRNFLCECLFLTMWY